jgi:predicted nucleic acid-binding protein
LKRCVVDASVGGKWFVQEKHTDSALALLAAVRGLFVPELFYAEVGSVLWKKARRNELDAADARKAFASLLAFGQLTPKPIKPLTPYALELALRHQCTVYDALYLALAVQLDCPVVTADRKLIESVSNWFPSEHLVWIGDVAG